VAPEPEPVAPVASNPVAEPVPGAAAPESVVPEVKPEDAAGAKRDMGLPPFERAREPLTLDARLGFSWRPQGDAGFDDEQTLGSELGMSLYSELKREIAVGLEIDRAGLGRGSALTGLSSVSADYTVWSAMLGFRAYPWRSELLDVFVGLQVGVGIESVSATGTQESGNFMAAASYECDGSDAPGLQIGGGVGARFMIAPRWGLTARVNGTGRRLSGDVIDECARGIGTTTSVSGTLGIGYDFDLAE
jgi:hypothetical protein